MHITSWGAFWIGLIIGVMIGSLLVGYFVAFDKIVLDISKSFLLQYSQKE